MCFQDFSKLVFFEFLFSALITVFLRGMCCIFLKAVWLPFFTIVQLHVVSGGQLSNKVSYNMFLYFCKFKKDA